MLLVTIVAGFAIGGALDYYQGHKLRGVLHAQLTERLRKQAHEDRIRFDSYVSAHDKAVTLIVSQKRFLDYIGGKRFSRRMTSQTIFLKEVPLWLPESSVLRSLVYIRYAILSDAEGNAREIYQSLPDSPPKALLQPSDLLMKLTSNQSLMTDVDGIPFLVTSQSVTNSHGRLLATLMLASPIDSEFLFSSQGALPDQDIVALLDGKSLRILATNKPDLVSVGSKLDSLEKKYLVTGKSFFDQGSSDLLLQFVSLIPTSEAELLINTILTIDKQQKFIITYSLVLSFVLIIFWITRKIRRLTHKVIDFSQHTLGTQPRAKQKGDELCILEKQFQDLTDEVVQVRGTLMEKAEELSKLYEETRELSLRDPLTGLANRRFMDIVIERSLAKAKRDGSSLSVIMLDIDYFKKYNDTYGHIAGDKLLVDLATVLLREVRDVDLVVRYGGEEFLIVLYKAELTKACDVAERIRKTVEEEKGVTVSLGVSIYVQGMQQEDLINAADAALYQAKRRGRNLVHVSEKTG
jgi:diguanylate cyclase (GGDEF)-like protein